MRAFVLRWAGLAIAIVLGAVAWGSWRSGEPPPWSLLAERVEARVIESRVESGRIGNGTMRHTPVVTVDRGAGPEPLAGLTPSFFDHREAAANSLLAGYRPGALATVRLVDGVAMADRQDLFQTAHAVFMSLMALVVGAIGLVLAAALGRDRSKSQGAGR